jgi:hypothetical protein
LLDGANVRQRLAVAVALLLAGGCSLPPDPTPPAEHRPTLGSAFDPANCGTITGQVVWEGQVPNLLPYRAPLSPRAETSQGVPRSWPNRRAPVINPPNLVANAVVFLRAVDPHRSRPWDHAPVRIEISDYQLHVQQDGQGDRYGFVQTGQCVEVVSHQRFFHSVQFRGAAFFALPLADAEAVYRRRLDRPGVVELTSAAGCFWVSGWLFVTEHPYYARTDRQGRFTLPQVPAGTYHLVCWLPDWREISRELDGDTWQVASIQFRPARTVEQLVSVEAGKQAEVMAAFGP